MNKVYIVEKVSNYHAFEVYDESIISFVTNDIQFAKNKIKALIKEEVDAFNINNDAIGSSSAARIINDAKYCIDHIYNEETIEYIITEYEILSAH